MKGTEYVLVDYQDSAFSLIICFLCPLRKIILNQQKEKKFQSIIIITCIEKKNYFSFDQNIFFL